MIKVEHLVKRYGNRNVVDNLSFTVEKGQTVAEPAEGLSVALHASIGGTVEEVTEKYVIIRG